MNISVTPSAFTLSGPLVAGERVGVSVSGFAFAEGVAPALALLARFPNVLLSSVELIPGALAGWTFADGLLEAAQTNLSRYLPSLASDSHLEINAQNIHELWLVMDGHHAGDNDYGRSFAVVSISDDEMTVTMLGGVEWATAIVPSGGIVATRSVDEWTGELDTATKQTALFFATARADERRDAVLELVAGRESLARLSAPMLNSILCPRPPLAFPF
jgi:hypothetical protein